LWAVSRGADDGDLFLLVDNNRTEIGIEGKNHGTEGRMIWLRNRSVKEAPKSLSRVQLRAITVPFMGAKNAPADAPDREQAKQLAVRIRERLLAGDDPVALARERKLYMRDAAYVISVSRVVEACRDRGWI